VDNLFGLSTNILLVAMLALLAASLSGVFYIALRNRIMFMIGVRNIPRRVAQTVLIVLGLMLSTLIITAAFTTGDTVDHSVTKDIYRLYGHVDVIVQARGNEEVGAAGAAISMDDFRALEEELAGDPNIDGLAPVSMERVPVVDLGRRQSAPSARLLGIDETRLAALPDLIGAGGEPLDLTSIGDDQVFVNESLAEELDTSPGSEVTVYYRNLPITLRVAAIARNRGITGAFGGFDSEGLVMRLDVFHQLFPESGEVDFIVVSNAGGLRDGVARTAEVEQSLERAFAARGLDLEVSDTKEQGLEDAELAGNGLMTFFLVFGSFSLAAGVLLIVMIFVMLAAERKSELGMARALGTKRWHLVESFVAEGMGYNLSAALVGCALGVLIAFGLARVLAALAASADFDITIEPYVTPRSLLIAYSIGVVLTFVTVTFSSWQVSRLNIVRAIRDIPDPEAKAGWRSLAGALVVLALSLLLIYAGYSSEVAFAFALGVSGTCFAGAILSRVVRIPARLAFTTTGLVLLAFWALFAGGITFSNLDGDVELFILSGMVMVASATYVLVYNADLLLHVLTVTGSRLGRLLPAIRMAVAYPLASKFRTGMTMAMIAIVVFALTMMSTMNTNFDRVFIAEANFGGWDVEVRENPSNPLVGGLRAALDVSDQPVDQSGFEAVGAVGVAPLFGAELCQPGAASCLDPEAFERYIVRGADAEFLRATSLPLQGRAAGYPDDRAVWDALAADPTLAVIDAAGAGGESAGFFGDDTDLFRIEGLDGQDMSFDPVTVELRNRATGASAMVRVIGVLRVGAGVSGPNPAAGFFGLTTSRELVESVFGEADFSNHYVRLADGGRAQDVAREIEAALLTSGAQASSMKKDRQEINALFNSFFYLMQGFAGLGLVVGVAAVGVVAFRSVVERRQQIGMLRAIGYSRGTVALGFLMESSFVALLGVASGVGLAVLLASFLLRSDEFASLGLQGVIIPWSQILLIAAFALGATLLMTFVPSRQAASIPVAEALRYE
jgi:putative ABC transport system permease protein